MRKYSSLMTALAGPRPNTFPRTTVMAKEWRTSPAKTPIISPSNCCSFLFIGIFTYSRKTAIKFSAVMSSSSAIIGAMTSRKTIGLLAASVAATRAASAAAARPSEGVAAAAAAAEEEEVEVGVDDFGRDGVATAEDEEEECRLAAGEGATMRMGDAAVRVAAEEGGRAAEADGARLAADEVVAR